MGAGWREFSRVCVPVILEVQLNPHPQVSILLVLSMVVQIWFLLCVTQGVLTSAVPTPPP